MFEPDVKEMMDEKFILDDGTEVEGYVAWFCGMVARTAVFEKNDLFFDMNVPISEIVEGAPFDEAKIKRPEQEDNRKIPLVITRGVEAVVAIEFGDYDETKYQMGLPVLSFGVDTLGKQTIDLVEAWIERKIKEEAYAEYVFWDRLNKQDKQMPNEEGDNMENKDEIFYETVILDDGKEVEGYVVWLCNELAKTPVFIENKLSFEFDVPICKIVFKNNEGKYQSFDELMSKHSPEKRMEFSLVVCREDEPLVDIEFDKIIEKNRNIRLPILGVHICDLGEKTVDMISSWIEKKLASENEKKLLYFPKRQKVINRVSLERRLYNVTRVEREREKEEW